MARLASDQPPGRGRGVGSALPSRLVERAAARPAGANRDAETPSRRTPGARSTWSTQRPRRRRRSRRPCRRPRRRSSPASSCRTSPSRTLSVNVRAAVPGPAGGPPRRRRGGRSRGAASARSWRSWANVSSWPIDFDLPLRLDRSVVEAGGQVDAGGGRGPGPSADDHGHRVERGEVADGRHAHPAQPVERRRADAPQRPTGSGWR